jgi:hypothetical protein
VRHGCRRAKGGGHKSARWSVILLLLEELSVAPLASGQEKRQAPEKSESKPMQKMSMDQMKDCMEHHQSMTKSIEEMSKTMEGAKQSNDPAKMRTAIDQAQKQLAGMKEHMAMCGNMMNMMEKIQSMGGMKGSSK